MNTKRKALIYFLLLFIVSVGFKNDANDKDKKEFPKPEGIKNMLFYIQRTINTNTIIYELNMNDNGELNLIEPIKMYWKDYATTGATEPLNFFQRKYAYGIDIKMIDSDKKSFAFNFVSYKKKTLYLIKSLVDGKYSVFCQINNKLIPLTKIFVKIDGGTFWLPEVKYVELTGKDFSKSEEETERVIP